jgi:hypothetical protein
MNRDRAARQGMTDAGLIDLPGTRTNGHRIVFRCYSFGLCREDPAQIVPAGTPESRAFLFRSPAEFRIELSDILLAQECVSLLPS